MKTFKYIITDSEGIHARPAGELVKAAKGFTSSIKIEANGKTGDCKKIFTLMAMGVKKDAEVVVTVEGEDEETAAAAMESFFQANL